MGSLSSRTYGRALRGMLVAALLLAAPHFAIGDSSDLERSNALDAVLGTTGPPLPSASGDPAVDAVNVRTWIRARMKQDAFYAAILPRLFAVLQKRPWTEEFRAELSVAVVNGRSIYFDPRRHADAKQPCSAKEQTQVVPWWNGKTKVWVCNNDYLPNIDIAEKFPHVQAYCEVDQRPNSACGCGKHLIYCAPTALYNAVAQAVVDEPLLTLRYIIEHHLPFSTLLTSNESMRPEILDAVYTRALIGEKMRPLTTTAAEQAHVSWSARPPQFTGGLLTMPLATDWDISRRVTGRIAWDDFLCMPLVAAKTPTAALFQLTDPTFRFHGQDRLTQMGGCKECHRRLEGIVHAYSNFTLPMLGHRFVPVEGASAQTSFYGRDSHDLRAEGPSTPAFIGATLVQQPEFPGCVARHVAQLFYGGQPLPAKDEERLRARFAAGLDFARLVEDAAVMRVLGSAALDVAGDTAAGTAGSP